VLSAEQLTAERSLIEASQQDPRRFAHLYERYFDRVYAFALARTGERARAEDVTAETFRRALQNLSSFEWRGVPFSAWLFRIAANVAVDMRPAAGEAALDQVPDRASESWEDRFIEVEEHVQLLELVKRLPNDQRQVVVLRFGQEKSIREISQQMHRSEGAIKQLQFRAVQTLRMWVSEGDE
jgi:RNA polymerase sigma-70 factor (ECF subfamily)